ncbi:MAG: hypothetical protein CMP23_12635 [Rickettsiales bacterium]|nr:hypothetical protein [Rickettsiales bacterium]
MPIAENQHYGHDQVLLEYCGLPKQSVIHHPIQHGWQPGPGFGAKRMAEPGAKILWSRRNLESAQEQGYSDFLAIGAPFLYLPEPQVVAAAQAKSLLAIPFHGWEKEGLSGGMERYAEGLSALSREGFGPITVCLYWIEYEQAALRAVFEERGFEVTTMGHRDGNPRFLHKQRSLMMQHSFVTSNRVCTAAFYALSLGVPFFLWGAVQGLSESNDPSGELFDAWQRETFPQLCRERFDGSCQRELGLRELGADFLRAPEELKGILHLGPRHVISRTVLRARRYIHLRQRRRGAG